MVDLRILTPTNATRTDDDWHMVISGNTANLILSGFVWLGTVRTLEHNPSWKPHQPERFFGVKHTNDHGTDYVQNHETKAEAYRALFEAASDADQVAIRDWYRAGFGAYGPPSIFWPDPDVNLAHPGRWGELYDPEFTFLNLNSVPLEWNGLSKGKPV
jgi:hypothetical protein